MSTATATLPISLFTNWLASGERGISSEAIVSHLTADPVGSYRWSTDWPHDPSDFRRCQLLLNAVPLARLAFPAMSTRGPQWARLVQSWDEIHASIECEVPNYLEGRASGSAPQAYRLMQRVIAGGATCHACSGTGRADPCPKCKGTARRGGGRCRNSGCHGGSFLCGPCWGRGYTGGTP